MSEPTKAAMKAAEAAIELVAIKDCRRIAYIASAIDRETGLPELVAALRKISDMDSIDAARSARNIAVEALRKAGEL